MRHGNRRGRLGRATDQRIAMLRSIVASLLVRGKIKVTQARAKEARRMAESVIELAKRGDLHSRRKAVSIVSNAEAVKKIFGEAPKRFADRKGGYTRITQIGRRVGDCAQIVSLELI